MSVDTRADTQTTPATRSGVAGSPAGRGSDGGKRPSGPLSTLTVRGLGAAVPQALAPAVLAVLLIVFAVLSPSFLTADNLLGVLNQNALLLLAAVAMTVVVRAGGIDLSIGVAIDLAALTASALLADDYVAWVAIVGGLVVGLLVGAVNAFLIVVLRIRPFLATLSVWFIGGGVQQVATDGGSPIYLSRSSVPDEFAWLGAGTVLGVAAPIVVAVLLLVLVWAALERSRWGRVLTAAGEQPTATRISGRLAGTSMATAFIFAAGIAAVAGLILASRSQGFVANSGQLYVLDSIGAVFIGTTLSRTGRPNLFGTLVGVLIFALLTNGMNLIGLSFYWQGLARGVVLIVILLLGVLLARDRARKPLT